MYSISICEMLSDFSCVKSRGTCRICKTFCRNNIHTYGHKHTNERRFSWHQDTDNCGETPQPITIRKGQNQMHFGPLIGRRPPKPLTGINRAEMSRHTNLPDCSDYDNRGNVFRQKI